MSDDIKLKIGADLGHTLADMARVEDSVQDVGAANQKAAADSSAAWAKAIATQKQVAAESEASARRVAEAQAALSGHALRGGGGGTGDTAQTVSRLGALSAALDRNRQTAIGAAQGFEDFFSVLSQGGLPMAIRATANNANQIATAFGPVAVILTTLTGALLPSLVKWLTSSNTELDKMAEKSKAATEELAKIRKEAEELQTALTLRFAPTDEQATNVFRTMTQRASRMTQPTMGGFQVGGGFDFDSFLDVLTQSQMIQRERRGEDTSDKGRAEQRVEILDLLTKAAEGQLTSQLRLEALFNRLREQMANPVPGRASVAPQSADALKLFEGALKSMRDQQKFKAEDQTKKEQAKRDAEDESKAKKAQEELDKIADKFVANVQQAEQAGLDLQETLDAIARGLRAEGMGEEGVTGIIGKIRDRLREAEVGINRVARSIKLQADEAEKKNAGEEQAKADVLRNVDRDRAADEQEKQRELQHLANQHLGNALQVLKRFHGDEELTRNNIVRKLGEAGLDAATVQSLATAMTNAAAKALKGEKQGAKVDAAMQKAPGREPFGDRFKREAQEASDRMGRPLHPKEVDALRRIVGQDWRRERDAERAGLKADQGERREGLTKQFGGRLPPQLDKLLKQLEKGEQDALAQWQRPADKAKQPVIEDQKAQQLRQAIVDLTQAINNLNAWKPVQPGAGQAGGNGRGGQVPAQRGQAAPRAFPNVGLPDAPQQQEDGRAEQLADVAQQQNQVAAELARQLNQLLQTTVASQEGILGTLSQVVQTIANLNAVNVSVRDAAQSIWRQIPSPASYR